MARNTGLPNQDFNMADLILSFDLPAIDDLIASQGITLVHYAAFRCPIGLSSQDDIRRPGRHDHPNEQCHNGFILTKMGEITVAFIGNSHQPKTDIAGRMEDASVNIILPRFYDDKTTLSEVLEYDRFYLKEAGPVSTVPTWETFECSDTGSDRLKYPAEKVSQLMDSRGIRYKEGVDFDIVKGDIVWRGPGPGVNPSSNRGIVCTVRYNYRPYWVVAKLLHEIRLAQTEGPNGRQVNRLPQAAILQREYFFFDRENDPETPPEPRKVPGSHKNSWGPR